MSKITELATKKDYQRLFDYLVRQHSEIQQGFYIGGQASAVSEEVREKIAYIFDAIDQAARQASHEEALTLQSIAFRALSIESFYRADNNVVGFQDEKQLYDAAVKNIITEHKFYKIICEKIIESKLEDKLRNLSELWNKEEVKSFLYAYDAFEAVENAKKDKQESFREIVCAHPDLQLAVLDVKRGTKRFDISPKSPVVRVVIDNKPISYEENRIADDEPDRAVTVVTAQSVYNSLRAYMATSLADMGQSAGIGMYGFSSNNDANHLNAVNVLAATKAYIEKRSNFEADAQERLKSEMENCKKLRVGSVYAHKHILQDKPQVLDSINFFSTPNGNLRDSLTYKDAAYSAVVYGHVSVLDALSFHLYDKDDDKMDAFRGYLAGVLYLHEELNALIALDKTALQRFEDVRGFSDDVQLFPDEEKFKLAYKNYADIAVAALSSNTILANLPSKHRTANDYRMVINEIPFKQIARTFIEAADYTNFMRLYRLFEHRFADSEVVNFDEIAPDYGVFIPPRHIVQKNMGGRDFMINKEGEIFVQANKSPNYYSIDQIEDKDMLDGALLLCNVCRMVRGSDDMREVIGQQRKRAENMIRNFMFVDEMKRELQILPEFEQQFVSALLTDKDFMTPAFIKELFPDHPDVAEGVQAGLEAFKVRKSNPLFAKVVNALTDLKNLKF